MAVGFFMYLAAFALLALLPPTKELLFVYQFLTGTPCFFFWIPFNILYFELAKKNAATLSTVYMSMNSLLGLMLPIASGYIAQAFSFNVMFAASLFVFLLPAVAVFMLKPRGFQYNLASSLLKTKGFKTLCFIEGVSTGGAATVIAVISLVYFREPLGLGGFLAVTTLFSVIASLIVSRFSDKTRKRKTYIAVFGCLAAIATIAAAFGTNLTAWYGAVGVRNFFLTLFLPFTAVILVDSRRDMGKIMVGNEWALNAGRLVSAVTVVATYLVFSNLYLSLAVVGWLLMLYPVVIELKRKHISVG
jgi:MFS family permease